MFRSHIRTKGAAEVGAAAPGEGGPFGEYGSDDGDQAEPGEQSPADRDAELLAAVAAAAEQRAADRIAAFRERRAAAQERREQMWRARQRGLRQRNATKLRQLADDGDGQDDGDGPETA